LMQVKRGIIEGVGFKAQPHGLRYRPNPRRSALRHLEIFRRFAFVVDYDHRQIGPFASHKNGGDDCRFRRRPGEHARIIMDVEEN